MPQTIRQNLRTIQSPPTDPETRAAYADKLIRRVKRLAGTIRRHEALEAIYLKQIRDGELWRGYAESFPAYLADPEIGPGISRSHAYRLIGNWEAAQPWIASGALEPAEFASVEPSKFELIAPAVRIATEPEQVQELVAQARGNGRADLRREMRTNADPETRAAAEYREQMERTRYRIVATADKLMLADANHAEALRHEIEIANEALAWLEQRGV